MSRVFTGLQPSGALHIGNYFGALKPIVDLFKDHSGLLMVADYHALTSLKDGVQVRENIYSVTRDFMSADVNMEHAILFKQSDVPEHTELAWIFDCLVTVPFLSQSHAYKDKVAKGLEANAGLFTYPMLMAADILLYDTDIVPVGADQRQHIEYAREAAAKFNLAYGETFKEPKELIQETVAVVPGIDGQKMSKSYKNTIPLFAEKDEIAKAVMSIVTDSAGERPEHVYAIHSLFLSGDELESLYAEHAGKYKALKDALVEDIDALVAPMRERRAAISDEDVRAVLARGREQAREIASKKLADVRTKVGVAL
jgi:tryptophanyl-tRNA synthetase